MIFFLRASTGFCQGIFQTTIREFVEGLCPAISSTMYAEIKNLGTSLTMLYRTRIAVDATELGTLEHIRSSWVAD